jgi:hypothetical protein
MQTTSKRAGATPHPPSGLKLCFLLVFIAATAFAGCDFIEDVFHPGARDEAPETDATISRWQTLGFTEYPINDGTIFGYCFAELYGDTFVAGIDASAAYLTISGSIPAGLTLVATRESPTKVKFTFTGKAIAHASANSTAFSITFKDAAFTGGNASAIDRNYRSCPVLFSD